MRNGKRKERSFVRERKTNKKYPITDRQIRGEIRERKKKEKKKYSGTETEKIMHKKTHAITKTKLRAN